MALSYKNLFDYSLSALQEICPPAVKKEKKK